MRWPLRFGSSLAPVPRLNGFARITSCAPPNNPTTLNERLEAALRTCAATGRDELNRTVPSTEVPRNIASQGRHIYAVTDRLLQTSGQRLPSQHDQSPQVSNAPREASEALRQADDQRAAGAAATRWVSA